ncbi:Rcd1 domain containing protein [Trichuris trichiura]|uniref:CCR4-NOT transcription complex subunit 9 n=1 Tax=Trichuris trichiura TaxID=36087 RepID=A0A077Z863_TRITR|nr:Rcd1 domain containing protein [Trichuris trichiura]
MESGLDGTGTENFLLHLINALQDRSQMNLALQLLCRYQGPEVGPLIWYCRRARTALLNELDLMHISTGLLNMNASEAKKVIRIIALLQRISSDPNLATQVLAQDVPYHLLPFITGISQNIYVESVCKASLVFFIRLLEIKREETITFLLGTNFINECAEVLCEGTLRVTENAVKIMLIFLQDQRGYAFICENLNRLIATINGLGILFN